MLQPYQKSSAEMAGMADAYFNYIEGEYLTEISDDESAKKPVKEKKVCIREPEPATFTGFALFMGFKSRQQFEEYEQTGEFASILKRGRLRIESAYEKKLHHQSPAGAIFALKSMGWNEKQEDKSAMDTAIKNMIIKILESGPRPSGNEKDVVL